MNLFLCFSALVSGKDDVALGIRWLYILSQFKERINLSISFNPRG